MNILSSIARPTISIIIAPCRSDKVAAVVSRSGCLMCNMRDVVRHVTSNKSRAPSGPAAAPIGANDAEFHCATCGIVASTEMCASIKSRNATSASMTGIDSRISSARVEFKLVGNFSNSAVCHNCRLATAGEKRSNIVRHGTMRSPEAAKRA